MSRKNSTTEHNVYFVEKAHTEAQNDIMCAFDENKKVLHKIVANIVGDNETAADIVQTAFVKVWNYSKTQLVVHPRGLFFKTVKNLATDELRRRSRHRDQNVFADDPDEMKPLHELPSNDKSPEEIILLKQEASFILEAIEKLPLKNRRAFKHHRFHGLTYLEISRKMDVSQSSVEKYIIEALRQLRHFQKAS